MYQWKQFVILLLGLVTVMTWFFFSVKPEDVSNILAFRWENNWTDGTKCYIITHSKPRSDFFDRRQDFVVDEELEAEYQLIESEYNQYVVRENLIIVAEGICKHGKDGLGEHNIPAVGGFSGSPVVIKENGFYRVIGMHNGYRGNANVLGRLDSDVVDKAVKRFLQSQADIIEVEPVNKVVNIPQIQVVVE
eukprot:TRINITY_DN63015_c0_g1_i1.p1 TRINITY_DN63015_c0_g1~~TRINITY_DN63015_c0_g1_i1.p1  ORF type:complete len:191 (+),score=32.73 TRINITY_DN63015_c0_g1_i1:322-894(+)